MAKEKKTSGDPAPRKAAAAKKSPAGKAAAPKPEKAAAAAASVSVAPTRRMQPSDEELFLEIRLRAYEFYRERGGDHGRHEADWHRAEREVRAKYNLSK